MACDKVVVSSPATIANFGPGFDSFGLCLESPRDRISMRRLPNDKLEVKVIGKHKLPRDPLRNTASYAAIKLSELCGCERIGFSMTIRKGMKPGSGLGSSAASSTGGALAMAALLGMRKKELILEAAAMGEELVAGSRHFDNVSAALYGGFTVVSDLSTRTVIKIRPPLFQVVVVVPDISIETKKARGILPQQVPMEHAVRNIGLASGMLHAMLKRNVRQIGACLDDKLALPYRAALIPGYERVRNAALSAGAYGVSLGGSGPAIFAITGGNASKIRRSMAEAVGEAGLKSESFVTVPGKGARVESRS
ncbi:MAG: homoserine kinase [Candidatus Thermoplasmatota archaeon]|nr:homoserine kinase [Candidatus Thermoplasmatota archaeon]